MVIGFYQINNNFNRNNLKVGDSIININGSEINSIDDLVNAIEKNVNDNMVTMTIKRDNKYFDTDFKLIKDGETYKTGLYVKDHITGIGTLSYIDPETRIYGALGHEIAESTTGKLIEVKTGSIFRSRITSIDRSSNGVAGTKNAKFYSSTLYGNVVKNTNHGIYGTYTDDISNMQTLEVGAPSDISEGDATIETVLNDEKINSYSIFIDGINKGSTKNIHFIITDKDLLNKAGGVVQGMSGSPIIQNNKIIGAVTHVIVDNPTTGYGIFITTMLEEGDKS
jgi:stage IV sporulation protein B